MTDQSEHPNGKVSYQEINSMRHNLQLLSSQLQSGKFDGPFLKRQVDKLAGLMERLESAHRWTYRPFSIRSWMPSSN
jgi:hypothetical protein